MKKNSLFESLGKYLIAAVLVIVPLFPKFPLISIPGTYVAIRFEDILLLILGIITFIKIALNIKSFLKDEIVQSFLIFFGVGLVSVLAGAFLTKTIDFRIGLFNWARRIEYIVPFFAVIFLLSKEKISENLQFYIKTLIVVVLIVFVYGLGQRYFSFPVIITQNEEYSKGIALRWTPGSHINSTFAGHYDLAAFIVLMLPIFLTLMVILKDRLIQLILLLTSSAGLWLLVESLSRTSQVAYLAAVGVALGFVKKFRVLALIIIVSVVVAGMSGSLDARFQRILQVIYDKTGIQKIIGSVENGMVVYAADVVLPSDKMSQTPEPTPTPIPVFEDRSTSIRLNVEWPRAIRALEKNPMLGTGYSSISLATDNDYLRLLGETGLLGFLSFFLIFVRIASLFVAKSFPLNKNFNGVELGFVAGVIGAIVGTFIIATFIDIFEASKFATIFWLILGYAVFLLRNKKVK